MKKILIVLLSIGILFSFYVYASGKDKDSDDGYEALFTHGNFHQVEILITQEEWDGLIQDMKDYAEDDFLGLGRTGNYRKATFIYKGPAGDAIIKEVGFRTKGNASRTIPQDDNGDFHRAHFKVRFNETFDFEEGTAEYEEKKARRFCDTRALVFRAPMDPMLSWDVSQIRELYCYDLLNRIGVYTSRTGSAGLTITIDGEKHYFGIYTLIENIDKTFLTKRFGKKRNDGNLYKCLFGDSGPATLEPIERNPNILFPEKRVIGVEDWETHYRPTYDLKTNEDEPNHTELINFIDYLNTLSGDALKEYLNKNFEVDRFLRYQAINVLLGKWDDYWTLGNNYYLYFNNDGKIEFIPFDYDMAIGGGAQLFYSPSIGIYEWENHVNEFLAIQGIPLKLIDTKLDYHSPLVEKMFEIAEYRDKYEEYLQEFITPTNGLFVYTEYEKKYDAMHDLYSPNLENDIGEGEEMRNDRNTRKYFYERTESLIDELGLNEEEYETKPLNLKAPTGILATNKASAYMITVTWNPVSYADYYRVYRSDFAHGSYNQIGNNISETFFNDQSVTANSTYYYKVKAFTNYGVESEFSNEVAGSTGDTGIITPTEVSATDGMYRHMIVVKWNSVLNADYYRVYRSDFAHGSYNQIGDNISETRFNDKSILVNSTYYYKVKAFANTGTETDFSTKDAGFASETGLSAPEIITGSALFCGTYSYTDDTGTTTYIFKPDKTCTRSMPNPENPRGGNFEAKGKWSYNEDGKMLIIDTSASLFSGLLTTDTIEAWENGFTTDHGSILYLLGLRKTTDDADTIVGRYEGRGSVHVTITGLGMDDDYVERFEGTVTINDNGTWERNIYDINGDHETTSGTWSAEDNKLIEFGGSYYLPQLNKDFLFIKQTCPILMILNSKEYINILRNIRDYRLQNNDGINLLSIYYSNTLEISSILSNNPILKNQLKELFIENRDIAEEFFRRGRVTVNKNIIEDVKIFLNKLKMSASPKFKKDIEALIEGIKDGDLLKGMYVNVD